MRRPSTFLAGFLAVGASSLLAGACADNESTLFIQGVIALDQTCVAVADPTVPRISGGILDVALRTEYDASLLVGNHLVTRGDDDRLRTETSRVHVTDAEVEVLDSASAPLSRADGSAAAFSVPVSGFAEPGSDGAPGYGIASVILVDSGTVAALRTRLSASRAIETILASVVVRGRSLGGTDVETSPAFVFPIQVCFGCLVAFPPESDDPITPERDCDAVAAVDGSPCRPGQDEAVPCTLCQGNAVCEVP